MLRGGIGVPASRQITVEPARGLAANTVALAGAASAGTWRSTSGGGSGGSGGSGGGMAAATFRVQWDSTNANVAVLLLGDGKVVCSVHVA